MAPKIWRVTLEGRDITFDAPEGTTLLDAARAAGVSLPFGCRYGSCLNCAARLVAGHVAMPPGTALGPEELGNNVFLPCVAEARSDCRIEAGGSMGILPVGPWAGGG